MRLKAGDKVLFYKKDNGEIVVSNTSLVALHKANNYPENKPTADSVQKYNNSYDNPAVYAMEMLQAATQDKWEKAGIHSEEDILALAAQARKEYIAEHKVQTNEA